MSQVRLPWVRNTMKRLCQNISRGKKHQGKQLALECPAAAHGTGSPRFHSPARETAEGVESPNTPWFRLRLPTTAGHCSAADSRASSCHPVPSTGAGGTLLCTSPSPRGAFPVSGEILLEKDLAEAKTQTFHKGCCKCVKKGDPRGRAGESLPTYQ